MLCRSRQRGRGHHGRVGVSGLRQWLGSIAFTAFMFVSVPIYALIIYACAFGSWELRFVGVRWWIDTIMWLLATLCGLRYAVEGHENLPEHNCVILMKHSSAWETMAQMQIFGKQTWVIKRELMWAPFLGWALALLKPIAINRRAGSSAVTQVIAQGRARLAEGFWVIVFPEGTRVPAGETRRYGLGGALLAASAGCPVVPVAHDAGEYWPRRGWLKRPGVIRVVIGPPIATADRDPRDVNDDVRRFIDGTLVRLAAERQAAAQR
jgi:1-acyl-sn-glycerol-3-phosphate acyltransferase